MGEYEIIALDNGEFAFIKNGQIVSPSELESPILIDFEKLRPYLSESQKQELDALLKRNNQFQNNSIIKAVIYVAKKTLYHFQLVIIFIVVGIAYLSKNYFSSFVFELEHALTVSLKERELFEQWQFFLNNKINLVSSLKYAVFAALLITGLRFLYDQIKNHSED